jgi:hypothetical protein
MEVAVSQGEVALRELVTGNESEGHFFGFAASFVTSKKALAEPKAENPRLGSREAVTD